MSKTQKPLLLPKLALPALASIITPYTLHSGQVLTPVLLVVLTFLTTFLAFRNHARNFISWGPEQVTLQTGDLFSRKLSYRRKDIYQVILHRKGTIFMIPVNIAYLRIITKQGQKSPPVGPFWSPKSLVRAITRNETPPKPEPVSPQGERTPI